MSEEVIDLDGAPLPVLRGLLSSEDPRLRADAACALGDRLRCRELDALEPPLLEALARLLDDEAPAVRLEAAIALAEAHDVRATPTLEGALSRRALRLDATRALGTLGDPRAVAPLAKLMGRLLLPWADRLQAAAALCALGDARGAEYLEAKVSSRREAESAAAIHFIGEARHPRARLILERILADLTHPMRDVAARALGALGDAGARPALLEALAHADEELRADIGAALSALGRIEVGS